MRFEFKVNVEIERNEGKFATRDEMAEQIQQEIESADPGSLEGDNGGQYSTTTWEVEELS